MVANPQSRLTLIEVLAEACARHLLNFALPASAVVISAEPSQTAAPRHKLFLVVPDRELNATRHALAVERCDQLLADVQRLRDRLSGAQDLLAKEVRAYGSATPDLQNDPTSDCCAVEDAKFQVRSDCNRILDSMMGVRFAFDAVAETYVCRAVCLPEPCDPPNVGRPVSDGRPTVAIQSVLSERDSAAAEAVIATSDEPKKKSQGGKPPPAAAS